MSEFPFMRNQEQVLRQMRRFMIAVVACCTLISLCAIGSSVWFANQSRQIAYFADQSGQIIRAQAHDVGDNRVIEAEGTVRTFHERFFKLVPMDQSIKQNFKNLIEPMMADNTALAEFEKLRTEGFYSKLVQNFMSQDIQIDSVKMDISSPAWQATTYATIRLISPTTITTRKLKTVCKLRPDARTGDHAHGFLLEQWQVLSNNDVKSEPINR